MHEGSEQFLAREQVEEFLAVLAHELRNPLAPILAAVHAVRLRPPDMKDMVRTIDIVERQAQHIARLVDALLDVSRITRGEVQLKKERLNLRGVLDHAIQECL